VIVLSGAVTGFQDNSLMNPLEQRIGYKFRNSLLLAEALTHPSLGHETQRHHFDNQRLEFLGDAVLQVVFTEHLFRLFPHFSEGQLTKLRSRLVSREGLKVHAIGIGLGTYLMMGRGEEASGGRQRASILADAFEALVGAIYLDSNIEVVRRFVLDEALQDIQRLTHQPLEVNPKGQLQEILQAISPKSPVYEIVSQTGPEHQKLFVAKVIWDGLELGSGDGSSKKQAETAAALSALKAKIWEAKPTKIEPEAVTVPSTELEIKTEPPIAKRSRRKKTADEPSAPPEK
jgi:ribonuclease III